jgi:hypothetical protein
MKMTPKQHAALLIVDYMSILVKIEPSKQCALKHCNYMIKFIEEQMNGFLDSDLLQFYIDVKKQIEIA